MFAYSVRTRYTHPLVTATKPRTKDPGRPPLSSHLPESELSLTNQPFQSREGRGGRAGTQSSGIKKMETSHQSGCPTALEKTDVCRAAGQPTKVGDRSMGVQSGGKSRGFQAECKDNCRMQGKADRPNGVSTFLSWTGIKSGFWSKGIPTGDREQISTPEECRSNHWDKHRENGFGVTLCRP